jgi:hypothetical protein
MAKQVSIDFLTRLKDKGLKDLKKQTGANEKALQGLQKQIKRTFSVVLIGAFVRSTTRAFLEEDKAIRRLNTSLRNVGQGFRALAVEDFISKTQLSSRVLDSELRPAMAQLINSGVDFEKSQKLLATALDISAGTGKDLQTVVTALSRAYLGNTTGLSRLQAGLSKTELQTLTFDQIVERLSNRFDGQAAAAADSYSGKLAGITIAVDEAQEAIGKDLIEALEKLAEGDFDKVLNAIAAGANAIGAAVNSVAFSVAYLREFLKTGFTIDPAEQAKLDALKDSFFGPARGQNTPAANRAFLTDYKKQVAIQKQIEADRLKAQKESLKLQKNSAAQTKRTAEIQRLKSAIQFKFDIDAINLQAALRRKISNEDRDRVLQLSALKISDYQDDAEALKTLQAATSGRYDDAMNFEKMLQLLKIAGFASDKAAVDALAAMKPQITFKDNLDDIIAKLKALIEGKYTIAIGATITVPNIPTPGGSSTASPGGGNFIPGSIISPGTGEPGTGTGTSIGAFPTTPGTGSGAIIETISKIISNQNTLTADFLAGLPSGLDANGLAAARYELQARTITAQNQLTNYLSGARYQGMANEITAQNTQTNQLAADRYTAMQSYYTGRNEPVVVNVNVQGSLLSQNDLVAAVTDAVYQTQRTGNALLIEAI